METLLIVVIALAGALGIVVILAVSSLLFVKSKYTALKDTLEEEREKAQEQRHVVSSTYVPQGVYTVKPPQVDDINAYQKLEEVCTFYSSIYLLLSFFLSFPSSFLHNKLCYFVYSFQFLENQFSDIN